MAANKAPRQVKLKVALADEELATELNSVIEEVKTLDIAVVNQSISDEKADRESADSSLDSRISMLESETVLPSGATVDRPADPAVGQAFFDATLGKAIIYNGSSWVNFDGTSL